MIRVSCAVEKEIGAKQHQSVDARHGRRLRGAQNMQGLCGGALQCFAIRGFVFVFAFGFVVISFWHVEWGARFDVSALRPQARTVYNRTAIAGTNHRPTESKNEPRQTVSNKQKNIECGNARMDPSKKTCFARDALYNTAVST